MAKILVVDDEPDMRLAIRNVLGLKGHQVIEAATGKAALERLKHENVELVLLDIRLPGMDGVRVLQEARKISPELPIVMITGYGHVQSAVDVMKLGASEYLAKPFENRQLVDVVDRLLSHQELGKDAGILRRRLLEKVSLFPDALPERQVQDAQAGRTPAPLGRGFKFRRFAGLGAVLLLLGAGFMLWKQSPWYYLAENDYMLESSNPSSMVWHDGELWIGDWLAQTIDRYAFQGKRLGLVRKYYLPGVHLSGFAIAGKKMYLCDSWKKTVQRRKLDEALTVEKVFPMKQRINNLFWDGKYLWSCGPGGAISKHKLDDSLTVLARFKLSNEPDQIYKDDRFFWSASSDARRIYKHRLDAKLSVIAEYEIAGLDESRAGHPLSAFAWHEGKLWITLEGRNLLMKRSPGRLRE